MVNYSALVHVVKKITEKNSVPCKKTLQKMVFLIEEKGLNIGCDYGIHFYGPYSSDLDFAVHELTDEGVLNIEYTPMNHFISINDDSKIESYENEEMDNVIDEFAKESPSELELIATVLYLYLNVHNIEKVRSGVLKIKGEKYSIAQINSAIERLKKTQYINI